MDYWLQLTYEPKLQASSSTDDSEQDTAEDSDVVPDNWLKQNHPLLLDIPKEQLAPAHMQENHIKLTGTCVKFSCSDSGVVMHNGNSIVPVASGDVIEAENYLLTVQINKDSKARTSDASIFGSSSNLLSPTDCLDESFDAANASVLSSELTHHSYSKALNPLSFLDAFSQRDDPSWLSNMHSETSGILDDKIDELALASSASNCLNSAIDPSVYRESTRVGSTSSVSSVVKFPDVAGSDSTVFNSMMYEDMQNKYAHSQALDASPLDEIDQLVGEYYDHLPVSQKSDRTSSSVDVTPTDDYLENSEDEHVLFKLKRKLWG